MLAGLKLPLAFLLDVVLGDPQNVSRLEDGIKRGIVCLERNALRFLPGGWSRRLAGNILALVSCGGIYGVARVVLHAAAFTHPLLGWVVAVFLIHSTIRLRETAQTAGDVYRSLLLDDISQARDRLAGRAGRRNVEDVDREGVITSTIEFVAMRTADGVVAPLFYAFLGGAELAVVYWMVCLLHSRSGTELWSSSEMGWASARLHTVAEFLPDRMTVLLLILAAGFTGYDVSETLRVIREYGRGREDGMAWPEVGFIGTLGLLVSNPMAYGGLLVPQDSIGDKKKGPVEEDIGEAVRLLYVVSMLMITFVTIFALAR